LTKTLAKKSLETLERIYYRSRWVKLLTKGHHHLRGISRDPSFVLVYDSKPYWRAQYWPEYKAGRKPKPEGVNTCMEESFKVAKILQVPTLKEPTFEADDLASSLVTMFLLSSFYLTPLKVFDHIYLVTVDSDWIQLVTPRVTWVNTGPWEPLLRTPETSLTWIKKSLKVDVAHPQDIVPIKSIKGDKSDNLPPGTPPYLIDLFNPPLKHNPLTNNRFVSDLMGLEWYYPDPEIIKPYTQALEALETLSYLTP
jgi:hypothetical protein